MTTNNTTQNFAIGETVYNTNFTGFERTGKVIEKNGEMRIEYLLDEKLRVSKMSEIWAKMPETENEQNADLTLQLDKVLDVTNDKAELKAEVKTETEIVPEIVSALTDEEKAEFAKLEREYFRLDSIETKLPFQKADVLYRIALGKLYRATHKTFDEYAKAKFGVTREYAFQMKAIGEYMATAKETATDKKTDLSINAVIQLIRNQNKFAESLGMEKTELSEFAPVVERIMKLTVETAKDEKGKSNVTPRMVNAVNDEVTKLLSDIKAKAKDGDNLIEIANGILSANKDVILEKAKESIAPKEKTGNTGTNSTGNGNSLPVYTGELPTLEIKCTLHPDFVGNKILSIQNGNMQTKCKCKFKMVGYDLTPIEIDGKKVKSAS